MHLTPNESQVIAHLSGRRVAQMAQLAAGLDVSTKTVQRALIKVGYFTSINHNATYVTLKDVPQFDRLGLWSFDEIHFSRHGNLHQTLITLIEQSSAGRTLQELEKYVGTHVHNHVSRLLRQGMVRRFLLGRTAVYVAAQKRQAKHQESRRRLPLPTTARSPQPLHPLPPDLDAITVIRTLVRLLETPDASLASVARSLQSRKVSIRADQIREILDFYGLKKTTLGA